MLHQRLSQKLLQKLSPQQIQLMKLLQVPTALLEQRIEEELEENPALEEGVDSQTESIDSQSEENTKDDLDIADYAAADDDIAAYKLRNNLSGNDEDRKAIPIPVKQSISEYLLEQLGVCALDERLHEIAEQLIGSIDEDGYIRRELDAIVDDLSFSGNIKTTVKELEEVLAIIQAFDPPGIGARDLKECLLLQLQRQQHHTETTEIAMTIIEKYFDEFAKKHYDKLQKQLNISEEELKTAIEEITRLNPKPASGYADSSDTKVNGYIIPDYTIVNTDGKLDVVLNSKNAPDLYISDSYREMLKGYQENGKKADPEQKKAVVFIKQKLDAAQWFIDAIKQRQHTLTITMQAILDRQHEYFLTGDETKLKPMILKDIAEKTNLDISTISRVTNSKYVQTEFGTYPLKYFFSEGIQTEDGEEVSSKEIKSILQEQINNENKKEPLSDQQLMEILKEKGYPIARRTVAKYREQLNISVARLRKEL